MCLLDIPNHVREAVEFGVHHGVAMALAIMQLHFGGNLRNTIGLLEGSMTEDLDRLMDDFDVDVNVVLGEVFVEVITCGLF